MALSSLSLQTNVASLQAQNNMARTEKSMTTSMSRLSSGLRINEAADDSAGLAISEKLRASVRSLTQAQRNANDGISLLQTAEGALNETSDMLVRMRELSVQAANGTLDSNARLALHTEFDQLRKEINRLADSTQFAGLSLLNGAQSAGVTFQVGTGTTAATDTIVISIADAHASKISTRLSSASISTVTHAVSAMGFIDSAITSLSLRRGTIGAKENRLYTTINFLASSNQNLSAANSRIRDADVAAESATHAQSQILMQAGISVLAQANQLPSMALSLISGR
jgi:flagellin